MSRSKGVIMHGVIYVFTLVSVYRQCTSTGSRYFAKATPSRSYLSFWSHLELKNDAGRPDYEDIRTIASALTFAILHAISYYYYS